jgi:chromosome segregation ATPase
MQLDDAQANLTAAEDDLSDALEDLAAVQEELDAAQEDLGGASDDLDDARSQNLLLSAALGVCAVLAVVMAVMFLSLRKKVAGAKNGGPGKEEP